MNDALKVVTTGSGSVGSLEPGWSVAEFSTPANPNEAAGGTGAVTFAGVDEGEGLLLINNGSTASNATLGNISGLVRNVSKTGQRISCSQDTLLSQYDVTRIMPPMFSGSVPAAVDLSNQVLKTDLRFTQPAGNFWSMNGHLVGFDGSGNQVVQSSKEVKYPYYNSATTSFINRLVKQNFLTISAEKMFRTGGETYAQGVVGDNFISESVAPPGASYSGFNAPTSKLDVQAKTVITGNEIVFALTGQPFGSADSDYGLTVTATIDRVGNFVRLRAEYRSGGLPGFVTQSTVNVTTLNLNTELAFRFYLTKPQTTTYQAEIGVGFSVCNTSNYNVVVNAAIQFTPDLGMPLWFDPWTIDGNVRAIKYGESLKSQVYQRAWTASEWEQPRAYNQIGAYGINPPSVGFEGNVWQWLQNACSAYGWEIGLENNAVMCRKVGSKTLDVTNVGTNASVTVASTFAGKRVDVAYTNATAIANATVYEARGDNNRILTVGVAETTKTPIQTETFLTSIRQPKRVTAFIPGAGTYFIIDATGLPIVANQWEAYGGSVTVAISVTGVGVIDVTFVGPTEQIPSTTAPYSLAVSDGSNQYAALSIIGSGVSSKPDVLQLLTGADEEKVLQDLAFTITNPFISTLEQAYDGGVWATAEASGPKISISLTVPTASILGFGLTQGSVFRYNNCNYRVTDATIGRLSTNINGVRHVTVAAFDVAYFGKTVAEHDSIWSGYVCEDQKPLTFKGVN